MRVASGAEVETNFEKVINEKDIQGGEYLFIVKRANEPKTKKYEDLHSAITIDELREKMHVAIHEMFAKNERIGKTGGFRISV